MNIHGNADSHIDALCHVMFDGKLYNGIPADTVTATGATELSIDLAGQGIVGRGLLLDIPRLRGVPWLEPGDHVTADDLLAAESARFDRIEQGDLLFVRVGHRARRRSLGPWMLPRRAPDCIQGRLSCSRSVGSRSLAAMATTTRRRASSRAWISPCTCSRSTRWACTCLTTWTSTPWRDCARQCIAGPSFLCVIAPLRLPAGTGSPVNPIAVF